MTRGLVRETTERKDFLELRKKGGISSWSNGLPGRGGRDFVGGGTYQPKGKSKPLQLALRKRLGSGEGARDMEGRGGEEGARVRIRAPEKGSEPGPREESADMAFRKEGKTRMSCRKEKEGRHLLQTHLIPRISPEKKNGFWSSGGGGGHENRQKEKRGKATWSGEGHPWGGGRSKERGKVLLIKKDRTHSQGGTVAAHFPRNTREKGETFLAYEREDSFLFERALLQEEGRRELHCTICKEKERLYLSLTQKEERRGLLPAVSVGEKKRLYEREGKGRILSVNRQCKKEKKQKK